MVGERRIRPHELRPRYVEHAELLAHSTPAWGIELLHGQRFPSCPDGIDFIRLATLARRPLGTVDLSHRGPGANQLLGQRGSIRPRAFNRPQHRAGVPSRNRQKVPVTSVIGRHLA